MASILICGQNMIHDSNRSNRKHSAVLQVLYNKILSQAIPLHLAEINLVIIRRICCIIFHLKNFIVMVFHPCQFNFSFSFNVQTQFVPYNKENDG